MYVPDGTYSSTVNLANRGSNLLIREIDLLRSAYAAVTKEHPIHCEAMVVLPDPLHAVWRLPKGDAGFSLRWKKIKATFSKHCIRGGADFLTHIDYCHPNPLKHGFVKRAKDWPHSMVHRA